MNRSERDVRAEMVGDSARAEKLASMKAKIGAQGEEAIGDGRWSDGPLAKDAVHRGELRVVEFEESFQTDQKRGCCRCRVQADGPKSGRHGHRLPKLLRNPGAVEGEVRTRGKSVGDGGDAVVSESQQRGVIEAMSRGYPKSGLKAMRAQEGDSLPDPLALNGGGNADKLAAAVERHESPAARGAEMTIAVECDGGSGGLQGTHLWPEIGMEVIRGERRDLVGMRAGGACECWVHQCGIAIVGNDGEDGLEVEAIDESQKRRPHSGGHGWGEVVDAQQILGLGRRWN